MHVDFIDQFRCPGSHPATVLVAVFQRTQDRFLKEGWLACPQCDARYPVRAGVAYFGFDPNEPATPATDKRTGEASEDSGDALRLAALLGLESRSGLVILEGGRAFLASALAAIASVRVVALNPEQRLADEESVCTIVVRGRLPFASPAAVGIAIGSPGESIDMGIGDIVLPGGRLVLPASSAVPPNFHELARDDSDVVAERNRELVGIRR